VLCAEVIHLRIKRALIRDDIMRREIVQHYRSDVESAAFALADVSRFEPFVQIGGYVLLGKIP